VARLSESTLLLHSARRAFPSGEAMAFEAAQTASRGAPRERGPCKLLNVLRNWPKGWHPHAIGLSIWASGVAPTSLVTGKMLPNLRASRGGFARSMHWCDVGTDKSRILHAQCHASIWVKSEKSRDGPVLLAAALEQGNLSGRWISARG